MKLTKKINTELLAKIAKKYNVSPEKYIADTFAVSYGPRVCAHFTGTEGELSVYEIEI